MRSSWFKKKLFNRIIQPFGWQLKKYKPSSDAASHLVSILNYAGVNVVFDVGANVGQFSEQIRAAGFKGDLVSFEPLSREHQLLVQKAARDARWLVHPRTAIGNQDGHAVINRSGNSVSSSLLPMLDSHATAALGSAYVGVENTNIVKLDSISHRYLGKDSRLFVKIDTQGYEWDVLEGGSGTLRLAKGVLCELSLTPLYEGQHLWLEIINRLETDGFTLWAIQRGYTHPENGRSLQMNAVFLRL